MRLDDTTLRAMPDIAAEARPAVSGDLDWVGMREIEVPVQLAVEQGQAPQAPARISAMVNLEAPEARGIHMSRLYLEVDRLLGEQPLTPELISTLLKRFCDSHEELSSRAYVRIDFDYMVRRAALASDNTGWRRYPVYVSGTLCDGQVHTEIGFQALYSSTCPCSAALARQLIQDQFEKDFDRQAALDYDDVLEWLGSEQGICATPHSQRSRAEIKVVLSHDYELFPFLELIDLVEGAVKTPVQTAVKREDEQQFALLNGSNLMFCEDAGRRIQRALDSEPRFLDFWGRVSHLESLHPHDAVAVFSKGVPGGFLG